MKQRLLFIAFCKWPLRPGLKTNEYSAKTDVAGWRLASGDCPGIERCKRHPLRDPGKRRIYNPIDWILRFQSRWGGWGGSSSGGIGAVVGGELFFDAGQTLDIVVGGGGGGGFGGDGYAGGGGGGSFVFQGVLLFAAGGGAGGSNGPGIGGGGSPGGTASYGGAGGSGVAVGTPFTGPAYDQTPAQAGSFPFGGAGACCFFGGGPAGGYGGGGGGGFFLDRGAGGGGGAPGGAAGSGGYSYVIETARNAFGITGGNPSGDGYVSINAVPEPSTWAMTLTGFAELGWLARLRRRKLSQT